MKVAYLSSLAHPALCTYLENAGHVIHNSPELRTVSSLVANHPDVLLCKLGAKPESPIYEGAPNTEHKCCQPCVISKSYFPIDKQ